MPLQQLCNLPASCPVAVLCVHACFFATLRYITLLHPLPLPLPLLLCLNTLRQIAYYPFYDNGLSSSFLITTAYSLLNI
jgi:hypothetical protein